MDIHYRMLRVERKEMDFSMIAIHSIDAVRFLAASNYVEVHISYQDLGAVSEKVANIHLDCEFKSGALARLDFLPVSGADVERIEINIYNGIYYLNMPIWGDAIDAPGRLVHIQNNKILLDIDGKSLSTSDESYVLAGFYGENESFLDDIRKGKKPEGDIRPGLQAVEVAGLIRDRVFEEIAYDKN